MRILYFGTYRSEYARNQLLIEGLRRNGVGVFECHETLWQSEQDRIGAASGGWLKAGYLWRVLKTYARLLRRYRAAPAYDVLVVGYPGHFDVFLAWLLARLRGKPLVWDVLNSLYLITLERGMERKSRLTVHLLRFVEKLACKLPDRLILDTQRFVDCFVETHRADPARFRLVQIGADDRYFQPVDAPPRSDGVFRVIYYGGYIPNHGVGTILEAAALLTDEPAIQFEMVGKGPERSKADALASKLALPNVVFTDWLERDALVKRVAQADLVLGAFGVTRQITLTNNNKIYEAFAMRKPVLSGETPALPVELVHGESLYLCERGNPRALAQAIRTLRADEGLRARLVENGWRIFHAGFDLQHIGARFAGHLEEVLTQRTQRSLR